MFSSPQTPFPGARDGQNLFTQLGEDRCTQFRVIVVTDPHRPPARPPARPSQTGAITIYTAPQLSAQCNNYHRRHAVVVTG